MSCRRDEIVSSNWCFKRCCWKVLIPAAKPPGVDTLKRYRKSRHPVQNEMKKGLSELKKRWKADYFGSLCVFFYLFLRTKVMNLCLLYWKEGVDFRGRHVELRLTELDYTLLLDTVVSRLMITIESISGWLAPWIVDSKTIHTQGAHDTITGHQWHIHCRDRFLVQKIKVVILSTDLCRVFIELTWKSLWRSSHYSFGIVQGDSDSQYSNHAGVGYKL